MTRRPRRGAGSKTEKPGVDLDLTIPSDVRYIEWVVDRVTQECEVHAFSPRQCHLNVPVALTEAISNAILRGNRGDAEKHVGVRAVVDDMKLVVEVSDEGAGFDIQKSVISPRAGDLEREDGRGLFLMFALMDSVEQFSDGRNVVRMTLHRR
jgi:serine/threonine-protein kinase RsbW